MSFNLDLKFGNIFEEELMKYIDCEEYTIMKGKFKEYDIIMKKNKQYVKIEVKADRLTYRTNNIMIEYECSKIPSGISSTQSDFYAYFVVKPYNYYDLYLIPTYKIKEMIKNKKYKRIVAGGDYHRASMYMFDISEFSQYRVLLELLNFMTNKENIIRNN